MIEGARAVWKRLRDNDAFRDGGEKASTLNSAINYEGMMHYITQLWLLFIARKDYVVYHDNGVCSDEIGSALRIYPPT